MKQRNGFVSNSSSTSFILTIKQTGVCEHCGRGDGVDIFTLMGRGNDFSDNEIEAIGKDEVVKYIKENWYDSDENQKLIKKIEKIDETKKKVTMISVSYHDETLINLIESSKGVTIMYREND